MAYKIIFLKIVSQFHNKGYLLAEPLTVADGTPGFPPL